MMVKKKIRSITSRMLCILALAATLTGCIKDDLKNCEDTHILTVQAYDAYGREVGEQEVADVTLFVFNGELLYTRRIETTIGQSVSIRVPAGESLHVVAWGNIAAGGHSYTTPLPGVHKRDLNVGLETYTRTHSYAHLPGDLFRGEVTLEAGKRGQTLLPTYREMSSMAVTVRGIGGFGQVGDLDYTVVVRETYSTIRFDGTLAGGRVAYDPPGAFLPNGDYHVPVFNLIPETGMSIDLYHGTELVATVTNDSSGKTIDTRPGLLTNVLIDLRTQLEVSVSMTEWGDSQVWKEF